MHAHAHSLSLTHAPAPQRAGNYRYQHRSADAASRAHRRGRWRGLAAPRAREVMSCVYVRASVRALKRRVLRRRHQPRATFTHLSAPVARGGLCAAFGSALTFCFSSTRLCMARSCWSSSALRVMTVSSVSRSWSCAFVSAPHRAPSPHVLPRAAAGGSTPWTPSRSGGNGQAHAYLRREPRARP